MTSSRIAPRIYSAVFGLVLVMALAACGGSDGESPAAADAGGTTRASTGPDGTSPGSTDTAAATDEGGGIRLRINNEVKEYDYEAQRCGVHGDALLVESEQMRASLPPQQGQFDTSAKVHIVLPTDLTGGQTAQASAASGNWSISGSTLAGTAEGTARAADGTETPFSIDFVCMASKK